MNALRVSCITFATIAINCIAIRFALLPTRITVSCDWFLSPLIKKTLESQHLANSLHAPQHYVEEALLELPAVKTIDTRIIQYKKMHVTAHGRRPWIMINNDQVLTHDGFVLPSYFFNTELLRTLVHIKANKNTLETTAFNNDLFTFLRTLPSEILSTAQVTWHNKTYIHLELPELPHITLIAHHATQFNQKILELLTKISEEKAASKAKKIPTYADIRFKNQIILSKREGAS